MRLLCHAGRCAGGRSSRPPFPATAGGILLHAAAGAAVCQCCSVPCISQCHGLPVRAAGRAGCWAVGACGAVGCAGWPGAGSCMLEGPGRPSNAQGGLFTAQETPVTLVPAILQRVCHVCMMLGPVCRRVSCGERSMQSIHQSLSARACWTHMAFPKHESPVVAAAHAKFHICASQLPVPSYQTNSGAAASHGGAGNGNVAPSRC